MSAFAGAPWANFSLSEVNEVKAAGGRLEFLTAQVHAKLSELQGSQADDELPELVCVLLNSQKPIGEIGDELAELLVIDEDAATTSPVLSSSSLEEGGGEEGGGTAVYLAAAFTAR